MIDQIQLLGVHASEVSAESRTSFATLAESSLPEGSFLLQTCHRVELYASTSTAMDALSHAAPVGARRRSGLPAARHLVRLAVGLESAVIAEDQVLHQLRRALAEARARGPLAPSLDRLVDIALRSGRRARTWLPPSTRSLAELAVTRVLDRGAPPERPVLIVGAGDMAMRAARALRRRGVAMTFTSRTPERALVLADEFGAPTVPFDPGPAALESIDGVLVALAGPWPLGEASVATLAARVRWVIDLSAPSALESRLGRALGSRLTTIDDLAHGGDDALSERLLRRLDELVEESVDEWRRWDERTTQRALAWALAERASQAQSAELDALWRRLPEMAEPQRAEVERMARHLAERLLREPLEQLADDRDGQRARAARELFRL